MSPFTLQYCSWALQQEPVTLFPASLYLLPLRPPTHTRLPCTAMPLFQTSLTRSNRPHGAGDGVMTGGKLALPRHQPSPSKDNSQLFIPSPEILRFVFCSGKTCTFWRTLYIPNFNSCRGVQLGKIKIMSSGVFKCFLFF